MLHHKFYFSALIIIVLANISCTIEEATDEESGDTVEIKKNFVYNDGDVEVLNDVEGNYELLEEDDILILTRSNFNHVIHTRDFVLVEFYAPWCAHCKSLAPEYSQAAKELKIEEINVTLAKVDATVETELAQEYRIGGFPTIVLFHKGVKEEEYNGERNADGIVAYMTQRADPNWKPPPTSVVELTADNFIEYLKNKPLVLVLFYAEYCQHCKKIKPEYINAAAILKEYGVPLAQIEGTNAKELSDQFKVKGWPTLLVFRYGRAFEYKGARETKGLVSYMKEQLASPTKECKTALEVENRLERYIPTVVGIFTSAKSKFYEEYLAVANYLRGEPLRFIHSFNPKLRKMFNVAADEGGEEAVIVIKPTVFSSDYEKNEAKLTDSTTSGDDIAEFIRKHYKPLVGQRTKQNQVLFYHKRPLVVIYYDANFDHQYEKASQIIRKKVLEVAKDFPDITFAISNEDDYNDELEVAKLDDSGVDVNAVWYDYHSVKYRMDPVEDFEASDLRNFVEKAKSWKLKPVWKSQPVPAKQTGSVFIAVADNFEEQVFKKNDRVRDVVFYIYAPWCGHCKEFEKTFKSLAKSMSSSKLLFAKMDGTTNDLPPGFTVKGYPTIFFIKATRKEEPYLYDGDRSYSHVKEFINQHHSGNFKPDKEESSPPTSTSATDEEQQNVKDEL